VTFHSDPFYAECRAYGRINYKSRKTPIAVAACHGFLSLPASHAQEILEKFNIENWNRNVAEYALPVSSQSPFRCIVKDFVEPRKTTVSEKDVLYMFKTLKALNRIGVYVIDIRPPNYVNETLIDLSAAWTTPHFMFKRGYRRPFDNQRDKNWELPRLRRTIREIDPLLFDKVKEDLVKPLRKSKVKEKSVPLRRSLREHAKIRYSK